MDKSEWGFFGHKRINRLAVFCLPEQMLPLFKTNIEYLTEHAVDPDKRRYASKFEGVRHYIDLDQWGTWPYEDLPRQLNQAIAAKGHVYIIGAAANDTLVVDMYDAQAVHVFFETHDLDYTAWQRMIDTVVAAHFQSQDIFELPLQVNGKRVFFENSLMEHGILPYNLWIYYKRLVKAFRNQQWDYVLRLSAEIGHYVGDAHVPLHTCSNYNGQLTNQIGIHAFWESRIPELLADEYYDYIVGRAEYIDDPQMFFWEIVLESNAAVDSVLTIEKELAASFPKDQQYCYVNRNNQDVLQPCPAYTKAFSARMDGMVERRFRQSIHHLASIWYSAWIDAGKPELNAGNGVEVPQEEIVRNPKLKARAHE